MANVLLTQKCVRSCPYCFAKKHMEDSEKEGILSWADFIYIVDLLERSGNRHISLLGGEPTLHPYFTDFLGYLLARNFHITVFTSGILKNTTFDDLHSIVYNIPNERLGFVCNLNDPRKTPCPNTESIQIDRFLKAFGEKIIVSFNIYQIDFDLGFLVNYINKYGLIRNIRLGLAHPIAGHQNCFINADQIDSVVGRILSFMPLIERFRIKLGFDCGFPLCKFTDAQLGMLNRINSMGCSFTCGPPVDIGPDMSVWSCFPLSSLYKKSVFEFDSLREINEFYKKIFDKIRSENGGLYEDCDNCIYREDGRCGGGCIAHILSKFENEPRVRLPEIYNEQNIYLPIE